MMKTQKTEKIEIDLCDVIELNITIDKSNGKPALMFRKIVSACDKNMPYVQDILKKALSNESDIIMPVRLKIYNKEIAIGKIRKLGWTLD